VCAAVAARAASLPRQIDDARFWQMVTDFSEAGGSFSAENFVSNEPNFQWVLTRLDATAKRGGAYLGVGPEQNFTYIAALRPSIAFIIDIRRQNLIEHLMYKAIFEMAADRADFLSILLSRKRPAGLTESSTIERLFNAYGYSPADTELAKKNLGVIRDLLVKKHGFTLNAEDLQTLEHVHHIFELYALETGYSSNLKTVDFTNGNGHNGNFSTILTTVDDRGNNRTFLATESNFMIVKDLENRNLLVPVVGDFGGEHALKSIAGYLAQQDATVSAFYVSNVEQYLFQNNPTAGNGGVEHFYESVAMLPFDDASTFIRSASRANVKQPYEGFLSLLGSMKETLAVFKQTGFTSLRDVLLLSQ
jgi:hypothetical protein